MHEWQPIETAPKDGSDILLAFTTTHLRILVGWWHDSKACKCWIAGGYMKKDNPPTHWMPLPEPPGGES